jgi:hypothetical protein
VNRHEREAFERTVVEYLDGALDALAAETVRQQAASSPEHHAVFEETETLWRALQELGQADAASLPRADFKDAILSALAAEELPADDPALESPSRESIAAAVRELFLDPPDDSACAMADALRARSEAHRQEVDAYEALAQDLTEIARDTGENYPRVDLREAVLATLAGDAAESPRDSRRSGGQVVSFHRGRAHRAQPVQWPLIAAAAVLLMLLGGWNLLTPRGPEAPMEPVAVSPPSDTPAPEAPVITAEPSTTPDPGPATPLESAFSRMAEAMPQPVRTAPAPDATTAPDLSVIGLEDVWRAQQAALADPNARASVKALATLPVDRARDLASQSNLPPDTLAGVAASLPPAEARVAMLAVREHGDPTPSRVFTEARATRALYEEEPVEVAMAIDGPTLDQIIAELRAIDPDNALTYYWEAIDRLQQGDLEGALALLETAESLESAHAYSLENARSTQNALEAAGMNRDSAIAAAALAAGMSEYDFLTSLGQDLMDEALRYDTLGHTEAAEQILTAAQRFGAQIEAGSAMSWEQLAGLDLQRAAIEALESFFLSPDDLMALTSDALGLVASMESVASFFDAFNNLFLHPFEADFFAELSQLVLQQGDLELFAHPDFLAPAAQKRR